MPTTFAEVLSKDRVEFDELSERYQPVLSMVEVLIGVVPKCDRYLEIWRPGFRTYNLMVPNFLNLPASLLGLAAPKDVVGLAMYTSSRAASCAYCSAHTCSFALRRGSSTEAVTGESRSSEEASAVAIAEALSTMPHHYRPQLAHDLTRHYGEDDADWIVMSVAMMGFLNKFMDAIGVELEPEAIGDVTELIGETGWSVGQHGWDDNGGRPTDGDIGPPSPDTPGTLASVFRNAPGAVRLDRQWMSGIPRNKFLAHRLVAETYGYDTPVLLRMRHPKPRRALAAILRNNLDPEQTAIGIGTKALAGLVFARHAGNESLATEAVQLARRQGVGKSTVTAVSGSSPGDDLSSIDPKLGAAVAMAHMISPSPAAVDNATITNTTGILSSAEVVEIAVWISVCQLLHRLSLFYEVDRLAT